jgi:hypothetical protein
VILYDYLSSGAVLKRVQYMSITSPLRLPDICRLHRSIFYCELGLANRSLMPLFEVAVTFPAQTPNYFEFYIRLELLGS